MLSSKRKTEDRKTQNYKKTIDDGNKHVNCNKKKKEQALCTNLVLPRDRERVTNYIFLLISQLSPTRLTNERIQRRNGNVINKFQIGYPGLMCNHCQGGKLLKTSPSDENLSLYLSQDRDEIRSQVAQSKKCDVQSFNREVGNYFFTSGKNIEKSCGTYFRHFTNCPLCPKQIKDELIRTEKMHRQELMDINRGSQREFFNQVWQRLHGDQSENLVDEDDATEAKTSCNESVQNNEDINPSASQYDIVTRLPPNIEPVVTYPVSTQISKKYSSKEKYVTKKQRRPHSSLEPHSEYKSDVLSSRPIHGCADSSKNAVTSFAPSHGNLSLPPIKLVQPEDKVLTTDFTFKLMDQLVPCTFTNKNKKEASGKLRKLPIGHPGVKCKHCSGRISSGVYFPSSASSLSKNSQRIYMHLETCVDCPEHIKLSLKSLHLYHSSQLLRIKGSRLAFFQRVWNRMHDYSTHQRVAAAGVSHIVDGGNRNQKESTGISTSTAVHNEDVRNMESSGKFITTPSESSFTPVPLGWSCRQCCWIPLSLRAAGSVVFGSDPPTSAMMRSHHEICKGERFHLDNVVNLIVGMIESVEGMSFELLVHPSFKAIVLALVGGSKELATVFTDGVAAEHFDATRDEGGRIGLWSEFVGNVNSQDALKAMVSFSKMGLGVGFEFVENKYFVAFVKLITPGCNYQLPSKDDLVLYAQRN
eukprot:CAMPEP_0195508816 /NCGR_PEP_ID=MMETSP0794_2-20130614/1924_1 /TAXON_ID=515487 /ORGANISM="Stephanopyxis turris, Strain CCMP 815" /LENGTH=697 /DNA_ID=CAMNT_0040635877 /DNA_START=73 /DNA_END=2166 /DNA_ORIENTATION=-